MFTGLRSVGLLDRAQLAKRRIHTRPRRLATKSCEKCGLGWLFSRVGANTAYHILMSVYCSNPSPYSDTLINPKIVILLRKQNI